MWSFLLAIVPLVLEIFKEFLSARARARQADEKFNLDQAALKKIVDSAVETWVQSNAKDSVGQGNAWDQADEDIKKK